jgi:uncharacterized glyoxalase superfamily protein PhnB
MTPSPNVPVSDVYPCLSYRDPRAALDWLAQAFGFERRLVVDGPHGPGETTVAHAEMSFGSSVVMLGSAKPEKGWLSPLDLPAVNQTVCLYVADPDAHHARAVAAGARIVLPLEDTDYGSRGYTAKDPEGHVWSFGTYRPGAEWEGAPAANG